MKAEHRECDEIFTAAEKSVIDGNFEQAGKQFILFSDDTIRHFKKEEEALFPTFEELTGNTEGPTQVMRYEHEQIRGLIKNMTKAIEEKDTDAFLSIADSMMIMLQQHNMKEEQMLYSMCDRMIPEELKESTIEKMKAI